MIVGDQEVVLTHPGRAHTSGDFVLYLPQHNIIVRGSSSSTGIREGADLLAPSEPRVTEGPSDLPLSGVSPPRR
jgi:hypothetical protein